MISMTAQRTLNVTVMLGGPSAEREISLCSGNAVADALRRLGHRVTELDPHDDESWALPPETELVFLALHGTYGEDGTVQEKLDELGVLYTGCGVEASRIAFDKVLTKQACLARGIPTARFEVLKGFSPFPADWKFPVVLKPVRQGSSVGLQFPEKKEQWEAALLESLRYDSEVLLEERIEGRETTVGILGNQILPIVEVRPKAGVYTYQNKYTAGATYYFCPADFDPGTAQRIAEAARGAFDAIGGRDYARVDVMVRPNGDPVVLEVNTLPGMTPTSLFPKAAASAGLSYDALCQRMIEVALERAAGEGRGENGKSLGDPSGDHGRQDQAAQKQ
jgi:D-alanine-D-alanine ligase